ncbi:MAG: hypothetical protein HKN91_09625 [Acidimicrobiia bacterium]|nr:hypothetical protein [Acidimicrobiia bacterium]
MNKLGSRTAAAAAVLAVLATACSSSNDPSTTEGTVEPLLTDTSTTKIAPATTVPPVTAPSTTTGPLTQQEAYQFIFGFDPVSGDAVALAGALEVTGPRPALGLPQFIEVGSPEVQRVVFASLAAGDPWSIPMLVAMQEYGMPSGCPTHPVPWPTSQAFEISKALAEATHNTYGQYGEMMRDLNRAFVANELELCFRENCDWGTAWYLPPSAVTNPLGMMDDGLFTGTVTVVSDTGAGDDASIMMQDIDGWVPIEGFLAEVPPFGVDTRGSGLFDGMVVNHPEVTVFGWAVDGTRISIGSSSMTVTDNWWELTVDVPTSGRIEVVGTAPDGTARAESLHVNYLPALERNFGYITDFVSLGDGQWALEMDYAQWFFGEEATIAAREDGEIGPDEFIDNDYYIRNQNPLLRIIPIDDLALVRLIDTTSGPIESVTVPVGEFIRILESGDDGRWYGAASEFTPFWFTVDGEDLIYQIEQQYIP